MYQLDLWYILPASLMYVLPFVTGKRMHEKKYLILTAVLVLMYVLDQSYSLINRPFFLLQNVYLSGMRNPVIWQRICINARRILLFGIDCICLKYAFGQKWKTTVISAAAAESLHSVVSVCTSAILGIPLQTMNPFRVLCAMRLTYALIGIFVFVILRIFLQRGIRDTWLNALLGIAVLYTLKEIVAAFRYISLIIFAISAAVIMVLYLVMIMNDPAGIPVQLSHKDI